MNEPAVCDIIIPIWNQPELTGRCLQSILRSTKEQVQLILIDNGSEAPTRRLLAEFQASSPFPVQIIRNEENLGFIKGVNQGIRTANAEWICLLNNDTIVTAGWLTEMIQAAQQNSAVGLINPTSNSLGFQAGKATLEEYAAGLKIGSGQVTNLTVALGFCQLAKRSLFDKIGLLNEEFGMGYFDDDDLSRRVSQAGLRCVRACASYVFHEEKGSFRHLEGHKKAFDQNKQRFEKIWGKRLRILWFYFGPALNGSTFPQQTALELLGQGHWLYLMAPEGTLSETLASHAQVVHLKASVQNWRWKATWRLLTRRKKQFHLAISYDPAWTNWLRRFRWLHGADLLETPTGEQILAHCSGLART